MGWWREQGRAERELRELYGLVGHSPEEAAWFELAEFDRRIRAGRGWPRDDLDRPAVAISEPDGDGWVYADGRSLPQPLHVRFAMINGRPRPVGLKIDNGAEITSETLRAIRLPDILASLTRSWRADGPDLRGVKFKEYETARADWAQQDEALGQLPAVSVEPKRGLPPSDELLRQFARTYIDEVASRAHGAVSRAARTHGVARSTAYRWLDLCRKRGYLQDEGDR